MRRRGRVARGLAVLVGFVAGALLTLAVQGPDVPPLAPEAPIAVAPAPPRVAEAPGAFLAWTPGRMPDGFASRARALGSIRHAVVVMSGTAWLTESRSASGAIVDRPPGGLAVPWSSPRSTPPLTGRSSRRRSARSWRRCRAGR